MHHLLDLLILGTVGDTQRCVCKVVGVPNNLMISCMQPSRFQITIATWHRPEIEVLLEQDRSQLLGRGKRIIGATYML